MLIENKFLIKNVMLILLIFGSILGSGMLIQSIGLRYQQQGVQPLLNQANGFSQDIAYKDIDQEGQVVNQVASDQLTLFSKKDSQFQHPRLKVYEGSTSPNLLFHNPLPKKSTKMQTSNHQSWTITADHAQTFNHGNIVRLSGHVLIDRLADNHGSEKHLRTETLTFYPKENKFETKDMVVLEQPDTIIRAKGLKADLDHDEVVFLANTEMTYTPLKKVAYKPSVSDKKSNAWFDASPKKFKTHRLVFHPKTSRAETNDFVMMEQAGVIIQAKGLKADLKQDSVTLLSKTKIIYTSK
jgi:LPS export ABC transporter protein LptC